MISISTTFDGALAEGDTIVTEGVQNVREGGSVTIKGAGNTASPKEPATAQANSKQAG